LHFGKPGWKCGAIAEKTREYRELPKPSSKKIREPFSTYRLVFTYETNEDHRDAGDGKPMVRYPCIRPAPAKFIRPLSPFTRFFSPAILGAGIAFTVPASFAPIPVAAQVILDDRSSPTEERDVLLPAVEAVLQGRFEGIDTAALMQSLRQRAQWGESDARFVEAEAYLRFTRGDWMGVMPLLKRLPNPSPLGLRLMAECLERKGDIYEAASYHLRVARALPEKDPEKIPHLARYIAIYPHDWQAKQEEAATLALLGRTGESADIYLKETDTWLEDIPVFFKVAGWLETAGRMKALDTLYQRLRGLQPHYLGLSLKHAEAVEKMGDFGRAGSILMAAWSQNRPDSVIGGKAIELLQKSHDLALLGRGLDSAVAWQPGVAEWRYLSARLDLQTGQAEKAYRLLEPLLETHHGDLGYLTLFVRAITGDEAIRKHFSLLTETFPLIQDSLEATSLLPKLARGYSLTGNGEQACKFWLKLFTEDDGSFVTHGEAMIDLARCDDKRADRALAELSAHVPMERWESGVLEKVADTRFKAGDLNFAAQAWLRLAEKPAGNEPALRGSKALVAESRVDLALPILKTLVTAMALPEANLLLGESLKSAGSCSDALPYLQEAKSDFPKAGHELGLCLVSLGDTAAGIAEFRALAADSGELSSVEWLWSLKAARDWKEEKGWLEILTREKGVSALAKGRLGLLKLRADEMPAGIALLKPLLADASNFQPGDWSEIHLRLGRYYGARQQWDLTIEHLSSGLNAQSLHEERYSDWRLLGDARAARADDIGAFAAYSEAVRGDPFNRDISVHRARLKAARACKNQAFILIAAQDLAEADRQNAEAQTAAGIAALEVREYEKALAYLKQAARLQPKNKEVWERLGNTWALTGDLKSATSPLQKALDLGSQQKDVFINRARCYRANGDKSMAESILSYLLTQDSNDYLALLWSARFAKLDGQTALANALFQKAKKARPMMESWSDLAGLAMENLP